MEIELRIQRFDPEHDAAPHWESYRVPVEPMDRVLDVLTRAKEQFDGSITFRRSCAHGVCGSDALLINGRNRLACKVRVEQLGRSITVAPLPGLPVVKDLVVDMDAFFGKYRSVMPYLVAGEAPAAAGDGATPPTAAPTGTGATSSRPASPGAPQVAVAERRQSPEQRAAYDDTTKCILCAACTTSCPSFWAQPSYVGPAAIVAAHRFIFDSRDEAAAERLELLADEDGVWRCRTTFNCVEACPRGINITKAILEVSAAIGART